MTKIIDIPEEVRDNLQALAVEVESRANLLAFMMNSNMSMASENFMQYQKEYKDYYRQYDKAKAEFQKKYVNDVVLDNGGNLYNADWNLDFDSCEVTINF